ncbi:hypothetical protein [Streptomyces sp. NPDC051001]
MFAKLRILVATVIVGALVPLAAVAAPAGHSPARVSSQDSVNDLTWG